MGQGVLKIGLDSAVFGNRRFLEWLRYTARFDVHASVIVYVETLLWYKNLGLTSKDLQDELLKLRASIRDINQEVADKATDNALKHGREFPFRHHARDYIIGSTAQLEKATLITYKIHHFEWLTKEAVRVKTPEDFVAEKL